MQVFVVSFSISENDVSDILSAILSCVGRKTEKGADTITKKEAMF